MVRTVIGLAQRERRAQLVLHAADVARREALQLAVEADPVALGDVGELGVVTLGVVALVAPVAEDQIAVLVTLLAHVADAVLLHLLRGRAKAFLRRHRHVRRRRAARVGQDHHVHVPRGHLRDAPAGKRLDLRDGARVLHLVAVLLPQPQRAARPDGAPHPQLAARVDSERVAAPRRDGLDGRARVGPKALHLLRQVHVRVA